MLYPSTAQVQPQPGAGLTPAQVDAEAHCSAAPALLLSRSIPSAHSHTMAQEAWLSSAWPAGKLPLQILLGKFLSKRAAAKFSMLYF